MRALNTNTTTCVTRTNQKILLKREINRMTKYTQRYDEEGFKNFRDFPLEFLDPSVGCHTLP